MRGSRMVIDSGIGREARGRAALVAVHRESAGVDRRFVAGLFALGAMSAALLIAPGRAGAQGAAQSPPQILVTGRGEIEVVPDRAVMQLGVETQAPTAAAASAENNRKQTAIIAAIRALGVPQAAIKTARFNVAPIQRYDDKSRRVVIDGYAVSNIVEVYSDKLEQTGAIIDAALANGSNRVIGLDFRLKDAGPSREQALKAAVESARRQAEVAAQAAGGTVAELLELSVNEFERPMPRPMMAAMRTEAADAIPPTPISEGTTTVAVSVTTRWRFAPGR